VQRQKHKVVKHKGLEALQVKVGLEEVDIAVQKGAELLTAGLDIVDVEIDDSPTYRRLVTLPILGAGIFGTIRLMLWFNVQVRLLAERLLLNGCCLVCHSQRLLSLSCCSARWRR